MNTEIVARLADAHARVLYGHEIESILKHWRAPHAVMQSWGATEEEVREAIEIAFEMADENPKRPMKKDGSKV